MDGWMDGIYLFMYIACAYLCCICVWIDVHFLLRAGSRISFLTWDDVLTVKKLTIKLSYFILSTLVTSFQESEKFSTNLFPFLLPPGLTDEEIDLAFQQSGTPKEETQPHNLPPQLMPIQSTQLSSYSK